MEFKKLGLFRNKIEGAIQSWPSKSTVKGPLIKPQNLFIYEITVSNAPTATLHIYHNDNGTTTIATKVGLNPEASAEIAEHIRTLCENKSTFNRTLYIKHIPDDEYDSLIEFLKGHGATISFKGNISGGKQYEVKGPYGDALYFNRYERKSFQIQGNAKVLSTWVIEGLTDLLPYKEVIQLQLRSYDIKTTIDETLEELNHILPTAINYINDKLKSIISPAVMLRSIEMELTDYSVFAFPALRALEGYMKQLFTERGVVIGKEGFGEYIDGAYPPSLTPAGITAVNCLKTQGAIEKCYALYKRQRHGLFHTAGIVELTKIIETRKEALDIVDEIFSTIEETYKEKSSL